MATFYMGAREAARGLDGGMNLLLGSSPEGFLGYVFEEVIRDTWFTERDLKELCRDIRLHCLLSSNIADQTEVMKVFRAWKASGVIQVVDDMASPNVYVHVDELYRVRAEKQEERAQFKSRSSSWEGWMVRMLEAGLQQARRTGSPGS